MPISICSLTTVLMKTPPLILKLLECWNIVGQMRARNRRISWQWFRYAVFTVHVVRVPNAILDCSHVTASVRQSPNIFSQRSSASCPESFLGVNASALTRLTTRSLRDPITMLNLNCYLRGDPRNCAFAVHINDDKTVSKLRDAIKEEIRPKFDNVPANELVLWKNSVPINRDLKRPLKQR